MSTNQHLKTIASALVSAVLTCATAVPSALALGLSEAELYIELNDTDGDLGLHASIDGGPYTVLEIDDPRDRTILRLTGAGSLARQGLTQFFFESAEPNFEELAPEEFFKRFPHGRYEISVVRNGEEFETKVYLSHVLAAPPAGITINGINAAESCDAEPLPVVAGPVVIHWDPVTKSHPEIGAKGPVKIARYQLFVEQGDLKMAVDLPPDITDFEVPANITAGGGQFKFEIIARTTKLNNTAIESCFVVVP